MIETQDKEARVQHRQEITNEQSTIRCRKPPVKVIKINSDVAVRRNGNVLVVVARDRRGQVLTIHTFISNITIPEVAELEAIGKALEVAQSQVWKRVVVESDSLLVIEALKRNSKSNLHWAAEICFN